MNFEKRMRAVKRCSVFQLEDEGFHVWCGSIAKENDSSYCLYFSFWPVGKGVDGWLTHSKIGFAFADNPLGPFRYGGIALAGAGGDAWDRDCVHNPAVLRVKDRYYLYYMGNYGDGSYWDHRNHQRIGVAYSDRPQGPFIRFDKPLVDVTPGSYDSLMTSNPTVCRGGDGRFYMMYKAVSDEGKLPKGGDVVCGMAVADTPAGRFVKSDHAVLANPENSWSVEDPFIWYEKDRFYALAKDFHGYFTNAGPSSVALFESKNGFDWKTSGHSLAFRTELHWEDGTVQPLRCMERPQMWLDGDGRPKVLCCACTDTLDPDGYRPFNVQIGIGEETD